MEDDFINKFCAPGKGGVEKSAASAESPPETKRARLKALKNKKAPAQSAELDTENMEAAAEEEGDDEEQAAAGGRYYGAFPIKRATTAATSMKELQSGSEEYIPQMQNNWNDHMFI